MYGRGITDDHRFIERALSNIMEFMEDDGQEFAHRRFVAPSGGIIRFARALNRAVTGSMNELIVHATALMADGQHSPFDVGSELHGILLSTLTSDGSARYRTPREAFKTMTMSGGA